MFLQLSVSYIATHLHVLRISYSEQLYSLLSLCTRIINTLYPTFPLVLPSFRFLLLPNSGLPGLPEPVQPCSCIRWTLLGLPCRLMVLAYVANLHFLRYASSTRIFNTHVSYNFHYSTCPVVPLHPPQANVTVSCQPNSSFSNHHL